MKLLVDEVNMGHKRKEYRASAITRETKQWEVKMTALKTPIASEIITCYGRFSL